MSNKLDERITRIRFDNDQFERGVATSMQSLDRLKNKLEATESVEAFSGITKAAEKTDLSGIAKAIDSVGDKFNALRLVAINVLSDIASQAINTGTQLVKSLSTDNIAVGWQKYNEEVSAVQTIMVTLDDTPMEEVEERLAKISWYSDETSYSYEQMVSAMSKLISSGVGLDEATNAVIGLANASAAAGVSTTKAQQAFYNFSQAFGAGYMKNIDWRSIEMLNMGTPEFKQNIVDTAYAMKKLVKVGNDMYVAADKYGKKNWQQHIFGINNMADSLKDKWFDKDVMNKVLNTYSEFANQVYEFQDAWNMDTASETMKQLEKMGMAVDNVSKKAFEAAQEAKTLTEALDSVKDAVSSKWKDTFKAIFGNYNEAKVLWTDVSNALYKLFAASGDVRNEILAQWNDPLSFMVPDEKVRAAYKFPELEAGRDILIKGLWNIYDSIVNVVNLIKDTWNEIFPQLTAKRLYDFTKRFRELTEKLKESTKDMPGLKRFLTGIFSVLKKIFDFGKSIFNLAKKLWPIAQRLFTLVVKIEDALIGFGKSIADFINKNVDLEPFLELISNGIETVIGWLDKLNGKDISLPAFQTIIDNSGKLTEKLEPVKNVLKDIFTYLWSTITKKDTTGGVWNLTDSLSLFGDTAKTAGYNIGTLLGTIVNTLFEFLGFVSMILGKVMEIISKVITWVHEQIEGLSVGELLKIFILGGIAKFLIGLAQMCLTVFKIAKSFGYILDSISSLIYSFARKNTGQMIKSIAESILMIAGAVFILSKIPKEQMISSINMLMTIVACIMAMYLVIRIVDGYYQKSQKISKSIQLKNFGFVGLGIAVLSMTIAIRMIAGLLEKDNITLGRLAGITAIVVGIALALTVISIGITKLAGNHKIGTAALYPLSLALSILMMVKAIKMIDEMELQHVGKIILTIIGILGSLFLAGLAMRKFSAGAGIGVLLFAVTFSIMIRNFEKISKMSFELNRTTTPIIIAITLIIGIFVLYTALLKTISGSKIGGSAKILGATAGILLLATSFIAIAFAFRVLDKVKLSTILTGGLVITAILGVMIGLTAVAGKVNMNAFGAIAALGILSVAMSILLGSIAMLAKAPLKGVLAATGSLIAILLSMSLMVRILAKAEKSAVGALLSIGVISAGLTVLLLALKALSRENPKKVFSSVAALGLLMAELLGMYFIIGKMNAPAIKAIPAILTITITAGLLGGALILFAALTDDAVKSIEVAAAIGIFALTLSASLLIIDKISPEAKFKNIVPLILYMGLLGTIVGLIMNLFASISDTTKIIKIAEALSLAAFAISVSIRILGTMPKMNTAEVGNQLLLFGGVVVILGGVITTMSLLLNDNNLGWIQKYGWQLLAVVGIITALTVLFGTIGKYISVDAALQGIEALAIVSGGILLIGILLYDIVSIIELVYEATGQNLTEKIHEVGDILWEIGSLISKLVGGALIGGLSDFGAELSEFSETVSPFIDFISSIPDDFADKLIGFAKGFAVFTSKGFWYNFKDLFDKGDLFANTLQIFIDAAEPIAGVANALSGIQNVDKAIASLDFIKNLGTAMTSINQAQVNRLKKDVYPALRDMTPEIKNFGNSLLDIDENVMDKLGWITTILTNLGDAAGSFYNEYGGLYQLGDIGDEIDLLGAGVKSYSEATSNITEVNITKSDLVKQMIEKLLELNSIIDKNHGAAPWFQGWTDIGKFGTELGKFITEGFSVYKTALDEQSVSTLKDLTEKSPYVVSAVKGIAELGQIIGRNKGLWPSLEGKTDYKTFGEQLGYLADGIVGYMAKMAITRSDVDTLTYVTNGVVGAIRSLVNMENLEISHQFVVGMEELARSSVEGFQSVFTSEETKETTYTAVVKMLAYIQTAALVLSENKEYFKILFNPLFDTIGTVINESFDEIGSDIETLTENVFSGFSNGVEDSIPVIKKSLQNLNENIDKANNTFWETKSPSKRTFRLGSYVGQGFANGITSSENLIGDAFSGLWDEFSGDEDSLTSGVEEMYEEISSVISGASDSIWDSNATILDNIKSLFSNLRTGNFLSGSDGFNWITDKFKEFLGQYTGFAGGMDGTDWAALVFESGGNPYALNGQTQYFDQLEAEFQDWLSQDYDLNIVPIFTDENGNKVDLADYQDLFSDSSSASLGKTVAGYTAEDVRNLTAEIYHLEDALYSLKNAMQDQQVTHSGTLTIRYANESDFIDRIQEAVIGNIRRGIRS